MARMWASSRRGLLATFLATALATALVTATGCGSSSTPPQNPGEPDAGPPPAEDGGAPTTPAQDGGEVLDLLPPQADLPPAVPVDGGVDGPIDPITLHMQIGPLNVAPQEEFVRCVEVKVGNDQEVWVRRIASALAPGSHHLILYRMPPSVTEERTTPFDCQSFEPILRGAAPLFIAQTEQTELNFPEGVAIKFHAGAVVRLEAHYINANPSAPIEGMGVVQFDALPLTASFIEADLLFYGPYDFTIPGRVTNWYLPDGDPEGRYYGEVAEGSKIFGITSHTHQLGVDFIIEKSQGGAPGELLHRNQNNWDDPPLMIFPEPIEFGPNEGLRWTCGYTNPNDFSVSFGESAYDEMCFLWAYYYPSRGFQICVPGVYGC